MDAADPNAAMREVIDADNRHDLNDQNREDQRQQKIEPEPVCLTAPSRKALLLSVGLVVHAAAFYTSGGAQYARPTLMIVSGMIVSGSR